LGVTFLMTRIPTNLDTTRVSTSKLPARLAAFEARRSVGMGRFLTQSQLEAVADRDLGRVIAERAPGLQAVNGAAGAGTFLFSKRGLKGLSTGPALCPIQVYLDGVRLGPPGQAADVADFKPQSLVGVEIHDEATTPAEYRTGNVCGVLLLWSK